MHDEMVLLLVQHGEAVAEEVDPERPLSEQGRGDIQALADFLASRGVRVNRILHSGKTRARQTAEILARSLLPRGHPEQAEGLKPKDPPQDFLTSLAVEKGQLMVCGHLPFLSKLVARLVTGSEDARCAAFAPGTLVAVEKGDADEWAISLLLPASFLRAG